MEHLGIGDQLLLDGAPHTVVGVDGAILTLRLITGAEQRHSTVDLFAYHDVEIFHAKALSVSPVADITWLQAVPARALQQARFWEQQVLDVLTPGVDHRSPWAGGTLLSPSLRSRSITKAQLLSANGHPVSDRHLRRLCQRYQQHGLWGLVDHRAARRSLPTGRIDPRVVAVTAELMETETPRSTGTRSRLLLRVEQRLRLEHGEDIAEQILPSRTSFYRLIAALDAGRYTFGDATTRRSAANRPERPFTPTVATRPGEQVQIDATLLDVMVEYSDGVHGRAEVTLAIDVATRSICAALLSPRASKSVDTAMLLARMIVPEPMRPGWAAALRLDASVLPYRQLIDADDRLRHAAARPVIVPETIVVDHGKVFLSRRFQDACASLGVSLQPAAPRTPTDKGVVERTFSSLNTLFVQYLAAYTGRSVTRRGSDVEAAIASGATYTLHELQDLLDQFIVTIWQNRPHNGLRDPHRPEVVLSPNEMYAAMITHAGYVPVPFGEREYLALLPTTWRRISAYGLTLHQRVYDSPDLGPLRHTHSGISAQDGKWQVAYDPYDVRRAWLHDPREDRWITLTWTLADTVEGPFSQDIWRRARQIAAERHQRDATSIAAAARELMDDLAAGPPARDAPTIQRVDQSLGQQRRAQRRKDRRLAARSAAASARPPLP
ncbi:DDE-type integrase/transposase/recombinase, partial [Kineococcus sp. R8]|uniref:Mu transposase C-terminal domain-containing protein n=1 Tax=Kineococcus siccus TaxID=2696567 RepID=UPI0014129627|nr:DDE-type integrase/transposase/recombinase [Kineococcus siccus]